MITMPLLDEEINILNTAHRAISRGAVAGAEFWARFFNPDIAEQDLTLPWALILCAEHARYALVWHGRIFPNELNCGHIVRGVVWAGWGDMNPAAVTIMLTEQGPETTLVHIRGAAREGWPRQRAGQQAAERIAIHLEHIREGREPAPCCE